jgi:gas vesicle protein
MNTQPFADGSAAPDHGPEAAARQAQSKLDDVVEPLKDKMREIAEQQKDAGAKQMSSIAEAVHGAAHEFEDKIPAAADYIHSAAARLEEASATMRNRGVNDLIGACGDFARREPAAFFGGAMIAGFAISRFLKSSGGSLPRRNPT